MTGQNFHLLIGFHIMHVKNVKIIKTVIERVANLEF